LRTHRSGSGNKPAHLHSGSRLIPTAVPDSIGCSLRQARRRSAVAVPRSSPLRSYSRAAPDSATSPVTRTACGAGLSARTALTAAAVARAAARCRLVHLSTDLVFSGEHGGYREEDEPAPVNSYGRSKAEAERRVAAAHPAATIVRTSLIYGGAEPGPQERLARENRRFFVDELRSPVQVGDLAEAILELLPLDVPGPLHLGGADDVSRFDFAVLLGADPAKLEPTRASVERAPNVTLDSSRARELLSTRLRGVREVLR